MLLLCSAAPAWSDKLPEYGIKAGFLYSFATYTDWPDAVGETITLCVYGEDPFGDFLDDLQGKKVIDRSMVVRSLHRLDQVDNCQVVFIARSAREQLVQVLDRLNGKPVLTVADTPSAASRGVAINMHTRDKRVVFEANLAAARANGLNLSARLLRLATDVIR